MSAHVSSLLCGSMRRLLLLTLLLVVQLVTASPAMSRASPNNADVKIFHLIDQKLFGETDGSVLQGFFACPEQRGEGGRGGGGGSCEVISTDTGVSGADLMGNLASKYHSFSSTSGSSGKGRDNIVTVGLYSIHSWGAGSTWPHYPDTCRLPTALNMAESEESTSRFHKLFDAAFAGCVYVVPLVSVYICVCLCVRL
jgi:hypothetical protein